jgi:hypothetical protein
MTVVRYMHNPGGLDRKVFAPGGKKIIDAVASAEAAIAAMTPAALTAIDAAIAAISAHIADLAQPSAQELVYRQAAEIHGAAATFGLRDLGEAAWSLCEMVDTGAASARSGPAIVSSHLDSLRLLRLGDAVPAEQRRAVLDGLQDLRLHGRAEPA